MSKAFAHHDLPADERPRERQMKKTCAVCGKGIAVILHSDHTYVGGHYFGKIP